MEQPIKKNTFSYFALPDLAFGFVHKRSGNEINRIGLHSVLLPSLVIISIVIIIIITSSNYRLGSAGLNAPEELLFRCWQ